MSMAPAIFIGVQVFGKDATLDGTGTVTGGTAMPAQTYGYQDSGPTFSGPAMTGIKYDSWFGTSDRSTPRTRRSTASRMVASTS